MDPREGGEVFPARECGELHGPQKQLPRFSASCWVPMIRREGFELRRSLQKNICKPETSVSQLPFERRRGTSQRSKRCGGPKVRASFEKAHIHTLDPQHRDEIQHSVVGQQRKTEISAGEFELHDLDGVFNRKGSRIGIGGEIGKKESSGSPPFSFATVASICGSS